MTFITKQKLNLNLTSIQVLIYFTIQFILVLTSSYFWFFNSFDFYQQNQDKTTLLSLIIEQKNRIVLLNLIELEEKIKMRQFELVIVIGSFIISVLSYYIYYTYYFPIETEVKKIEVLNRRSLMEQARQFSNNSQLNMPSITIDSFHDTSSISSITESSLTNMTESIVSSNPEESKLRTNMNKHKSLSLHFSIPYEEKFIYGYETSSGVISSASSLSSVYKEISYFHRFSEPFTMWSSCNGTLNKSSITVNNLNLHNKQFDEQIEKSNTNNKIMEWFRKEGEELEIEIKKRLKLHRLQEKSITKTSNIHITPSEHKNQGEKNTNLNIMDSMEIELNSIGQVGNESNKNKDVMHSNVNEEPPELITGNRGEKDEAHKDNVDILDCTLVLW
ncbi:unnamed protein product [Brachionus calyciflorus]|uniref:Transmembrane protein n=1 Tax=Brachionus calyciflorus TaxID=104777 RepID=A0A814FIH7_9BILA|nr:unnamed protein product [Brachionus calyciflorus]